MGMLEHAQNIQASWANLDNIIDKWCYGIQYCPKCPFDYGEECLRDVMDEAIKDILREKP
jgi:hypothetical protein